MRVAVPERSIVQYKTLAILQKYLGRRYYFILDNKMCIPSETMKMQVQLKIVTDSSRKADDLVKELNGFKLHYLLDHPF